MGAIGDIDWGDLISKTVTAGTQAYMGIQQLKAQKKAAKAAAQSMSTFPMLGTGNMRFGGAMGYGYAGGVPLPPGSVYAMGQPGASMPTVYDGGYQDITAGGSSTAPIPVTGFRPRFPAVAMDVYGRPSRPIGRCLLSSGDLAAARRVGKVARKLGTFIRHRRPR